jgi:hypothetical protein
MKIVDWFKGKLSGYIHPDAERSYPPRTDTEIEVDDDLPTSLRFRVTTVELPATADDPKRESTVYYVYGHTKEEALGRISASLLVDAKVEAAGCVEGGILRLPEDERRPMIFDGRAAPGTPGPV